MNNYTTSPLPQYAVSHQRPTAKRRWGPKTSPYQELYEAVIDTLGSDQSITWHVDSTDDYKAWASRMGSYIRKRGYALRSRFERDERRMYAWVVPMKTVRKTNGPSQAESYSVMDSRAR